MTGTSFLSQTAQRLLWLAVALALPRLAHADLCEELGAKEHAGKWAIAPFDCAGGTESACAQLVHTLSECGKLHGIDILTPGAVTAIVDEEAVRLVLGSGDMKQVRKMGSLVPAQFLVTGEISKSDLGAKAVLRLLRLEDGRIVAGARVQLNDKGEIEKRANEATHNIEAGSVRDESVEVGLRMLADRLAEGYAALTPDARYKRLAVLDFADNSPGAAQKKFGRVVAAELMTRLRRDHRMILVERSHLDQIMREFILAQQGAVDEKNAPQLGKMLEANAVIIGSISELGGNYVIHAQIVDVESAVTVVAESVSLKAEGLITLASEALVLRTKGGAIYRSLLLPGWGQLYNRQADKGFIVSVVAGTLALGALGTHVGYAIADRNYDKAVSGADFDGRANSAANYKTARNVLLGLLLVTWGYNVGDAYLNGQTFDSAVSVGVTPQPGGAEGSLLLRW